MKFLDANGLARFTQKLFSKFISSITGENNVITVTKGDGTKNTIDLNAIQKTDTLSKDPPDDDNSQKIATTSWVQKLVAVMVFKLIAKLAGTTETGVSSSGSFLGVHWLIAQNGYIAFGPFFGNLILQWGTCLFPKQTTEAKVTTPISFKEFISFATFPYGQGVHSVFGGFHNNPNILFLYRHIFFAENVNCMWLGIFK